MKENVYKKAERQLNDYKKKTSNRIYMCQRSRRNYSVINSISLGHKIRKPL